MGDSATISAGQQLQKNKRLALFFLLGAVALFVISVSSGATGLFAWTLAASEAALVGGLADWFAVVALFRHPLGLPFPHTAILPKNRDRLASRLAEFLRSKFLNEEAVLSLLQRHSLADFLRSWLARPRNRVLLADQIRSFLLAAVQLTDFTAVRETIAKSLTTQLRSIDLSFWTGQLLHEITKGDRHQDLLSDALGRIDTWLEDSEVQAKLAAQIEALLAASYPKLFSWASAVVNKESFCQSLSSHLLRGTQNLLTEIHDDPQHPKRIAFDQWVQEWSARLRADPEIRAQVARWRDSWLSDPAFLSFTSGLVEDLRQWAINDLSQRHHSHIQIAIRKFLSWLAALFANNADVRRSIDQWVQQTAVTILPDFQDFFCQHVEDTIRSWPLPALIQLTEEGIGTDLQFIRINGTVVGAGIGLAIHALFLCMLFFVQTR